MLRFGWLSPYLSNTSSPAPPKEGPECEIQQQQNVTDMQRAAAIVTCGMCC